MQEQGGAGEVHDDGTGVSRRSALAGIGGLSTLIANAGGVSAATEDGDGGNEDRVFVPLQQQNLGHLSIGSGIVWSSGYSGGAGEIFVPFDHYDYPFPTYVSFSGDLRAGSIEERYRESGEFEKVDLRLYGGPSGGDHIHGVVFDNELTTSHAETWPEESRWDGLRFHSNKIKYNPDELQRFRVAGQFHRDWTTGRFGDVRVYSVTIHIWIGVPAAVVDKLVSLIS